MAKLRFFYSVMNAGKTVHLLQVNYNYVANGGRTILFTHSADNRFGEGVIKSRLGIEADALSVNDSFNIYEHVQNEVEKGKIDCILVDESQFFTRTHIEQLAHIVDKLNIPVMCYGLRTTAYGKLFEGSQALFELADEIEEIKQICFCGRKATMVLKFTRDGQVAKQGKIIDVGAEEKYISVCRNHWSVIESLEHLKLIQADFN